MPSNPELFASQRDIEALSRFAEEMYALYMRRVIVCPFVANEDPFYHESSDKEFPANLSYETPGFIADLPAWRKLLRKGGIDTERDLTIAFNPITIAKQKTLEDQPVSLPRIGFHVVIQNERYKIMSVNPTDYFGNTDIAFTLVCPLMLYRPDAVRRPRANEVKP